MSEIDKWGENFEKRPVRSTMKLMFIMIMVAAVAVGGYFVIRVVFFPFEQAAKIAERTFDGDNVISNYEWFHQTYEDVQALDRKIEQAKSSLDRFVKDAGPRTDWTFDDRQEHGRLNAVLQGLQNQRADVVATYNARSKMSNRDIFKDKQLPESL